MHMISSLAFIAYSLKWSFATFALERSVRLCFHLERVQASCVLRPLVVTRGLCRCNPRSDINEGYCVCLYALLLFHCILTLQWLIQQNLFFNLRSSYSFCNLVFISRYSKGALSHAWEPFWRIYFLLFRYKT